MSGFRYTDKENEAVKIIEDLLKIHFELGYIILKRDNEDIVHTIVHGEKSSVIHMVKESAELIEFALDNDDMPPLEEIE